MSLEQNPFFLKKKYNLHTSEEVERAARRQEQKSKRSNLALREEGLEGPLLQEKVPQDPASRIQNYLDRFKEITDREDPADRERGLEAFKRLIHRTAIIKPENVPESAFILEQRIARELGHGTIKITDEFRNKKGEEIINNQTQSLDKWIDYLASPDAQYPDWAKYWAFRSVLGMGKLEKKTDEDGKESAVFKARDEATLAAFPPHNPRALAVTIDALLLKLQEERKPKDKREAVKNLSKKLDGDAFQKLLSTENFSKIYTQFLIELPAYSIEGLQETRGKWIKYPQGSDPAPLVNSLEGYPLEWCTAGYDTARTQLMGGDFYVYYSIDEDGNAKIPRAAIRMEQDSSTSSGQGIAEVRGIAPDQNLDPYIGGVVQEKMKDFPDGEAYAKKAGDMKQLTAIEKKLQVGEDLDKDELVFLYEMNGKIKGFGYDERDPRVDEFRSQRNPELDMPTIFGCEPNQIARNPGQVDEFTQAYVGPFFPNIFNILGHLEHIYTFFPEGKIIRYSVEIGGQTAEQLKAALERAGIGIHYYARPLIRRVEFKAAKGPEQINLVRLKVGDLFGDQDVHTTDDIYRKADQLGLELCPAEVGPHLRLKLTDQPINEWLLIAMKQIANSEGRLYVFMLESQGHGDGLLLSYHLAEPTKEWPPECEFVFRLRK